MDKKSEGSFWLTRKGLGAAGLIAAAAYFVLTEHRAHFIEALPYLILLLCPLMHLFMHHGHGGHGAHSSHDHDEGGDDARR